MNTKKQSTIAYIACAVYGLVFISLCFNNNVWLDEAFTATLVHTDFADVIVRSMADTLPPLYNILLKISTDIFGYTIPVMKLTSVLPMILTLVLGATTVRKRFGFVAAMVFMTCITGMPLMFYYGIEIRMYSLGFFFATASGIYAYETVCDFSKKNCILFAVFSTLAGYSHHFAFVAVGFVYLFLLIYYIFAAKDQIKHWFESLAITIVLYLPCLVVTLRQFKSVSGYFSMPEIDAKMFVQYVLYPFSTGVSAVSVLLLALVASLLTYGVYKIVRNRAECKDYVYAIGCFLVYYGVLVFGTLICKVMTANIFVDRYLFFSTGLIWLSVAVIFSKIIPIGKIKYLRLLIFAIIGATFVTTYIIQFRSEYGNNASDEIAFITNNFLDDDTFLTVERHEELQFCIPFYSILAGVPDVHYEAEMQQAIQRYKDFPDSSLWIVVQDGYEISKEDLDKLSNAGLSVEYAAGFDFDRYLCDVYKVR